MELRILGPLELVSGRRTLKVGGPREYIVLAALALRPHRVVSVEQLVSAVWADNPPSTARSQIQGCISGLRRLFGDAGSAEAIVTRPTGYLLALGDDVLDAAVFARLTATARGLSGAAEREPAAAALRAGLDLWRGPALDGIASELVQRGAAVLEESRLAATEELARLELELGRHAEVITELRELIAEAPLRERLYGFLMVALYRTGRQVEALEVFRQARETMTAELGIEPCQELRDLQSAVLRNDPALDLELVVPPVARTPEPVVARPSELPSSIADFTGRSGQLADIGLRLRPDPAAVDSTFAVPMVAVTGPGGVGKSTLAVRAAHELRCQYPDGQVYVDFRTVVGEQKVAGALAHVLRALGVGESAVPEDPAARGVLYRSLVAGRRVLLLLDDVADEQEVMALLPGTHSCAVIVTSRGPLAGLPGAYWVDLAPFGLESARALLTKLLGAGRVDAEPTAVGELITYCGGLPLALRIAGARLAARPAWRIADLVRRLRNEMSRLDELSYHGLELRSSISLSYRALTEPARKLFGLLALSDAPLLPGWVGAVLLERPVAEAERLAEDLVDAQLLQSEPAGYRFHDLLRVYARERLAASLDPGERQAALARLLGAWLELAVTAHRREYGGDYTVIHGRAARTPLPVGVDEDVLEDPMRWLDGQRGSVVAAVRQAAAAGLDELCWDLALTAVSLFEIKGHLDEWQETTDVAYEACLSAGNRIGCAAMLYSLGNLHVAHNRLREAEAAYADALTIFTSEGNGHGLGLTLRNAAVVDRLLGRIEAMRDKCDRALVLLQAAGDIIGQANVLRTLGKFALDEADFDEAERLLTEARSLCRQAGHPRAEAQVLGRIAELLLRTGRTTEARQAYTEVLTTVRRLGDPVGEAHALYGLGLVRSREGKLDSAQTTLANALAVAVQVAEGTIEGEARYALGEIALARGEAAVAVGYLDRARQVFDRLGSGLWEAKTLILLSEAAESVPTPAGDSPAQYLEQARHVLAGLDSRQAARLRGQLGVGPGPEGARHR